MEYVASVREFLIFNGLSLFSGNHCRTWVVGASYHVAGGQALTTMEPRANFTPLNHGNAIGCLDEQVQAEKVRLQK